MNGVSFSLHRYLLNRFKVSKPKRNYLRAAVVAVTHGNRDPEWHVTIGRTIWVNRKPRKYHRGWVTLYVSVGWLAAEFPVAFLRTMLEGSEILDPTVEEFCKERTLYFQQSLDPEEDERAYA